MNGCRPLRFENGSYYNKDGSEFKGDKTPNFVATSNAIDELRSTDEGFYLLDDLQNSESTFLIREGSGDKFQPNSKGGRIYLSFTKVSLPTTKGMEYASLSIILGHEMSPAFDYDNGMLNENEYVDGVKKT